MLTNHDQLTKYGVPFRASRVAVAAIIVCHFTVCQSGKRAQRLFKSPKLLLTQALLHCAGGDRRGPAIQALGHSNLLPGGAQPGGQQGARLPDPEGQDLRGGAPKAAGRDLRKAQEPGKGGCSSAREAFTCALSSGSAAAPACGKSLNSQGLELAAMTLLIASYQPTDHDIEVCALRIRQRCGLSNHAQAQVPH